MRPIVTVTLNPAIDRTAWIGRLEPGATHRTAMSRTAIGGKGINVARTAGQLGAPVLALGIAGEDQARRIEQHLEALGIRARFRAVAGETRNNLKLIEQVDGRMTEINGTGPAVSAEILDLVAADLFEEVAHARPAVVVLSGSLPGGVPVETYARWTRALRASAPETLTIVDASDEPLTRAIAAGPFLVKPNRVEAEQILGRPVGDVEDARRAAAEIGALGPDAVLLSLGAQGAVAALGHASRAFAAEAINADPERPTTTVGAGDAMVARIAVELARRDAGEPVGPAEFFAACQLAVEQAAAHIAGGG
ncbi:MAG: 1-phosphofructokinase family hexose kinase [Candidatus Limnocylindrales bacterium]